NQGMSRSLIAGVTATLDADGWMIGLGDMPYVASETIVKLTDNLSQSNIVVPRYRQQLGNPVGFGSLFKDELLALRGDRGGKSIVQQHSRRLTTLDTQDQGVVIDLDTPDRVR
ncbi:MAG: molybdenum cofactor cytidylyltransferase, partial [Arenicella sp.]